MLHNTIQSRNDLSANGGIPISSDHHDQEFQLFLMVLIVSVKQHMKCIIMRFQESAVFDWYWKSFSLTKRLKMNI